MRLHIGVTQNDDELQQPLLVPHSSLPASFNSQQQQQLHQTSSLRQTNSVQGTTNQAWPASWQDASSWAVRDPVVAGSLAGSYMRTRHPEILDQEQMCRSPMVVHHHGSTFGESCNWI